MHVLIHIGVCVCVIMQVCACAVCSSVWVLQCGCGVCFSVALLSPLNFLWFVLAIRIMVLFRMITARSRSPACQAPSPQPAEASHSNWWRPIRLALPRPRHTTVCCSSWFLGFEPTEGQYSSSCNMLQYLQTLSYNLKFCMFYRSMYFTYNTEYEQGSWQLSPCAGEL